MGMISVLCPLFDNRPIESHKYVKEEYIGYGSNDLPKLTDEELKERLKLIEKDIEKTNEELEESDNEFPIYSIKERIKNLEWDRENIINEIQKRKPDKEVKESGNDEKHIFKVFRKSLNEYK